MSNFRKALFLIVLFFLGTFFAISAPQNKPAVKSGNSQAALQVDDTEDELSDELEELPGKNFEAEWPMVTRIADMLPARTVQNGPKEWIYETQHFRFISDAPIALAAVKELARIFEGTYTANLALPINSPCNHHQVTQKGKFVARLFETYDGYVKAGGLKGSAGVFFGRSAIEHGRVLVPFQSLGLEKRGTRYVKSGRRIDAKTLSHEITHHMTSPGMPYPLWFMEGIAEYVGISYSGNGQVRFSGNKTVISKYVLSGRAIGKQPNVGATLQQFLSSYKPFIGSDSPQVGYGVSALLVYYFFHLDGKRDGARIKKYLAAIQNKASLAQANEFLLDGRSWEQLEKEICRRLKSVLKIDPQFKPHAEA